MRDAARHSCSGASNISVVGSLDESASGSFDAVTMNPVWMCLPSHESCKRALGQIRSCLKSGGYLVASFTHPCFRMQKFATFHTDFDNSNYLKNGTTFQVHIFDGIHSVSVTDTHWSFTAMSEQLYEAGFVIARVYEIGDPKPGAAGSPWVVLVAKRV